MVAYAAAAGGVTVVTALIGLVRTHARIANISSLYLIIVLAVAAIFGGGPAIAASVLAVLAFDWFFVNPVGQFTVSDPEEWLALVLFLATAIVTSQLAAAQQRRAVEARRREREATALYTLSSLIVQETEPVCLVERVIDHFADELELLGAALYLPGPEGQLERQATFGPAGHAAPSILPAVLLATASNGVAGAAVREGLPGTPAEAVMPPGLIVALRDGSRALGILWLARHPEAGPLSAEQRRFLETAGQQLGIALERARLQTEATEAAALRRADEMKTALLSAVSHDLRTPLALIKAAAGSLRQTDVPWTDEERDGFAASIEQEVDRLDRIVANLLDLSQIATGTLRMERQHYPLAALVEEVLARLQPLLVSHPVAVEIPEDLPPVPVDYVAIDRVLSNLLENVARHTPPGTTACITARHEGDRVIMTVADNGPGIPPADLPRVFDAFYRGRSRGNSSPRGTGLGLAVARGLVEAHGGTMTVASLPGGGTTFTLTLPLDDPIAQRVPAGASGSPQEPEEAG
ncbi:MAG: DUF4118 domain-containing protein [Chloroflexi bacterium]|nr:DUF4118 domain-containing protein [Chloroflexota bacterium]